MVMSEASAETARLSEVSRLAGVLADQVLRESMVGEPSLEKLTALGRAVLLLQDYEQPVPDLVMDVLARAIGGAEAEIGDNGEDRPLAADDIPLPEMATDTEESDGRRGLFPRLLQSLRIPKA